MDLQDAHKYSLLSLIHLAWARETCRCAFCLIKYEHFSVFLVHNRYLVAAMKLSADDQCQAGLFVSLAGSHWRSASWGIALILLKGVGKCTKLLD